MTNLSLQKKTAARMAAVQCLYTLAMNDGAETPSQQVERLKAQLKNNRDEQKMVVGSAIEPHYPLVETLLSGIADQRDEIDTRLGGALSGEWKRERMSPLLVAILQCGIFELCFGKEIKPTIIIDEYTRLTRHFFAEAEADFVHAALRKIVTQYS